MKVLLTFFLLSAFFVSCSSTEDNKELIEREHDKINRDYIVTDSSSDLRPGWIEDAEIWAKQHSLNVKKYRYFSYETSPKVNRAIACDLAKAKARASVAAEITTFIDQELGESSKGRASLDETSPLPVSLREYVENNLTQKVQALVHGAAVAKTYWEKRKYQKERGAKRDFTAFTCSVFIRMDSNRLKDAIDEASDHVVRASEDPETKAKVKKALKNASENYIKLKAKKI